MGRKKSLSPDQAMEAAEMYMQEGKSRRQVTAHFKVSEQAIKTAFSDLGLKFRKRAHASTLSNKARIGFLRKSQFTTSVWDLGRAPRRIAKS